MADIYGVASLKMKGIRFNVANPRKETGVINTFRTEVKVQCDEDDWYFRAFIAWIVLYIGTDWL
jgi:hypothetical protein